MSEKIRVLIVDDHAIFRKGLAELLAEEPGLTLIGEAADGEEAIEKASQTQPDVILMDVHMPGEGGIQAVRALKGSSDLRILMLTVSEEDEDLRGALRAGADGYLLKNSEPEELYQAIRSVATGRSALSPEITPKVMKAAARGWGESSPVNLSPREQEVIHLLARGATTKEIAEQLVISKNTVKTHVHRILQKMDASNRAEAVARAAEMGMLHK